MCEWYWLVPKCASKSGQGYNLAGEYYYGGYSTTGDYQTTNILQTYNGLGTLGVIKLGGVTGVVQKPIINSNILVSAYQGSERISPQSTQILHTDGLLKPNLHVTNLGSINLINDANDVILGDQAVVENRTDNLGNGVIEQSYQLNGINVGGSYNGNVNIQTGYVGIPSNINSESAYIHSTVHNNENNHNDEKFGIINSGLDITQQYSGVQQSSGSYPINVETTYADVTNQDEKKISGNFNNGASSHHSSFQYLQSTVGNNVNNQDANPNALYNTYNVGNTGGNIDIVEHTYPGAGQTEFGIKIKKIQEEIKQPILHTPIVASTYSVVPTIPPVTISSVNTYKTASPNSVHFETYNSAPVVVQSEAYETVSSPVDTARSPLPRIGANSFIYQSQENTKADSFVISKPSGTITEGFGKGIINAYGTHNIVPSTPKPNIAIKQTILGNIQETNSSPQITFQELAPRVTVSIPFSPVTIQPAVSNSYSYSTTVKPAAIVEGNIQPVQFVERKPTSSFKSWQQPRVFVQNPQVYFSTTQRTLLETVSTNSINKESLPIVYNELQPSLQLKQPQQQIPSRIISSYSIRQPENIISNVPFAGFEQQIVSQEGAYVKPLPNSASVTSSYISNTNQKPTKFVQNAILNSENPALVDYSEQNQEVTKTKIVPAVVTQYQYQKPAFTQYNFRNIIGNIKSNEVTSAPQVHTILSTSTSLPIIYSYTAKNTEQNNNQGGYFYSKPETSFKQEPEVVIQEAPFVKKTAYVTGQNNNNINARDNYNFANVVSSTPSTPVVVENYLAEAINENNSPIYQDNEAGIVKSSDSDTYDTLKPHYVSTVSSVTGINAITPQQYHFYDSRLTTPKPLAVGSYSYFVNETEQNINSKGYSYPKPEISFDEEPKINIQETPLVKETVYITEQNNNFNARGRYNYVNSVSSTPSTPIIVENYLATATHEKNYPIHQATRVEVLNRGSDTYVTPKPQYVSTVSSITEKNTLTPQQFYFYDSRLTTLKPLDFGGYSYLANETEQNINSGGYAYPKPEISFKEEPKLNLQETPFVKETVNVQGQNNFRGRSKFNYLNVVSSTPTTPVIVESYQAPAVNEKNYQIYQTSGINVVNSESITPQQFHFYDSRLTTPKPLTTDGYFYSKPAVEFEEKPSISTKVISSTEKYIPVVTEQTSRPISKYSFSSLNKQYAPKPIIISTPAPFAPSSSRPIVVENYYAPELVPNNDKQRFVDLNTYTNIVSSTPKPTFISTISSIRPTLLTTVTQAPFHYYDNRLTELRSNGVKHIYKPAVVSTTFRPTETYSSNSLNSYTTTPILKNTVSPIRTKVRTSSREPIYISQRSKIRYTSTTEPYSSSYSTEFVPLGKLSTISLPVEVTTPSRDYLPTKQRVKTGEIITLNAGKSVIKQNDFLPLLSAKLGAQCTCVSSNLRVRKKQRVIIVDDDENDDGYVVGDDESSGNVENYTYDQQRTIVKTTSTPQITWKSSTPEATFTPIIRKKIRQKGITATAVEYEDDTPSNKDILKAVKTGLKLVKQAAKDGAREGTEDAIQNNNLRVRDKIECQRAGLFRHPNKCNKFYSCKWDCDKNKYVLHSFNCPIQLTFDSNLGACNWPSQGPACAEDTLLPIQ